MAEENEAIISFRGFPETKLTKSHVEGSEEISQEVIDIISENTEKVSRGFTSTNEPICLLGSPESFSYSPGIEPRLDEAGNIAEVHCNSYISYISGCGMTNERCKMIMAIGHGKMRGPGI